MAHYDQKWDDLGRSIQDAVDRAVNSQDYQKLNQTVRQAVNRSVDIGSEAVRKAVNGASGLYRTNYQVVPAKKLYGGTAGRTILGVLMTVYGGMFSLGTSISLLITALAGMSNIAELVVRTALLALCLGLTCGGARILGMVRRFKIYRRTLGNQTHCTLERLARSVGRNEAFVRKELWQMIGKGMFLEGHMDKEETSLITSHETFRYYEQSRLAFEERQRQEAAAKPKEAPAAQAREAQTAQTARDAQVQEVLDRGNAFIAEIRRCNDAIPGEEISGKISRMELIVQRIFERAEAHPEIVPDLKKMMDYYLPMTVKLLNAYADMDAQPIAGETIQSSKREIEDTLDTLNLAFEKLLDSVFEDTAMDISSDISVLNTLLAQEGLTEDGLSQMKKEQTLSNFEKGE